MSTDDNNRAKKAPQPTDLVPDPRSKSGGMVERRYLSTDDVTDENQPNKLRALVDDAAALRRFADDLVNDAYPHQPAAEREAMVQQIMTNLRRHADGSGLVCPVCGQAAPVAFVDTDDDPTNCAIECGGTEAAPHEPTPFGYRQ